MTILAPKTNTNGNALCNNIKSITEITLTVNAKSAHLDWMVVDIIVNNVINSL